MNRVFYFGYGANRDPAMMEWITGITDLKGKPGVLKGYKLVIQRLDQLPDIVLSTAPEPLAPSSIIAKNWPPTFESYTITKDPESEVYGTIWELTPEQRELVRDWELVDFGWYKDILAKVMTENGEEIEVQAEGMGEDQEYDREVNGRNYETWLQPPEDLKRIATKARIEYFNRIANPEGNKPTSEQKG